MVTLPSRGFRAVGLLADYAEVQEEYETAIEQFLREELEYVVVESFDQARAGVALLREDVGGRATFFVDSARTLDVDKMENGASMPGNFIARLDRLVEFREPLGPATKYFLKKLRTAYIVESIAIAEQMAHDNPHSYFLTRTAPAITAARFPAVARATPGRWRSSANSASAKPKPRGSKCSPRSSRRILSASKKKSAAGEMQLATASSQQMEAEKSLVAAAHQRDQARREFLRVDQQLDGEREEIARLRGEAEAARARAEQARLEHAEAVRIRAAAEAEAAEAAGKLADLRLDFQELQERVVARREELATMSERLASAEGIEQALSNEIAQANERVASLRQQHATLASEKTEIESSCEQLALQAEDLRQEKARLEENKAALETEWTEARSRTGQIDETLRGRRQSLDELRAERSQRQIEKARNDADRDYLRQTCVAELNAQPEELMAQESQLLIGEELVAAETNYNEMKARVEAMGPVNMMALEEFQECEQREGFLRRERDDLVQSIQNTQLTINELDQVSRQKFEEAFNFHQRALCRRLPIALRRRHGEMRLSEPDSSGDAGIDIVAQPPGKRLQNILLLSGGEKALTALALLIAVFRYSPEPVLHPRRSGRAARRSQRRPLQQNARGDVRADAVHRRHAQPQDHGNGIGALRRHHAGAGRFQACLREVGRGRRGRRARSCQAASNAA